MSVTPAALGSNGQWQWHYANEYQEVLLRIIELPKQLVAIIIPENGWTNNGDGWQIIKQVTT